MITSIIIFGAVILSVGIACATSDDDSTIDPNEIKNPYSEWEERQPYNP